MENEYADPLILMLAKHVRNTELSPRLKNSILLTGSKTMFEFFSISDFSERYKSFGQKSLDELDAFLSHLGLDKTFIISFPILEKFYIWKSMKNKQER